MRSTTKDARSESSIFSQLESRYPHTVAAFSTMSGGERALTAVAALQERWVTLNSGSRQAEPFNYVPSKNELPDVPHKNRYDVVIAGGGLGLVAGAALAMRGLKALVFDRDRVGAAHREWNISERELAALSAWAIFTTVELKSAIATRYSRGVINFSAEGTGVPACPLSLDGVLDVALDAQAILDLARKRFIGAGGTILEGRSFQRLHMAQAGEVSSVFEVEGPGGTEFYGARLAIDTMGSVSPIAMALNNGLPFDGVCPTAGTVMEGLDLDPQTGDVLVSVTPAKGGRQLIWEGFPGRNRETTVYLFYYDKTGPTSAAGQSLLDLFEQYFTLLPTYRPLHAKHKHIKPVYGYIPARHGRTGRTAARGLLCLGDSAAGQSPLTFCGFGSFVRHIGRVASLLDYTLEHGLLEERHLRMVSPHQANLRVAWVFSRFMQPWPGSDPAAVNRLMNIFCRGLRDVGASTTARFLQDRYLFTEYIGIMLATARRYPQVFALTAQVLGPAGLLKWAGDIAAFGGDSLLRSGYTRLGIQRWRSLERITGKVAPGARLRLASMRTGWRATR